MTRFFTKYAEPIQGILSGFDRLVFRATLRRIANLRGFAAYLSAKGVLLKDFDAHADKVTKQLIAATVAEAERSGVPLLWEGSSKASKEEKALAVARERGISAGPICIIKCVEPCQSFEIRRNREAQRLELAMRERKCAYLYHYLYHPEWGFMNARIQTWFPFNVQICINGREWLARQMDAVGMRYERSDNCFAHVEDFEWAQELMNTQLQTDWPKQLDTIARIINPLLQTQFEEFPSEYYWTVHQCEWATDIVFHEEEFLRRNYPKWMQHAMTNLGSEDVMRFLDRAIPAGGRIPAAFAGEVTTDMKRRREGVRIKHSVKGNSVKAYDKLPTLLRIETTVNTVSDFRAYRPKQGGPEDDKQWRRLRKGVADLHRLTQISQRSNERYLEALASADDTTRLGEALADVTKPTIWKGKRVRALHPFEEEEQRLLQAVSGAEFVVSGLRNRDLQQILFADEPANPDERRRRSAWVGRKIRLLRAHGILQKVNSTHRYQVTARGRTVLTAILAAHQTPIGRLADERQDNAA